jgi:hypothetical protein
MARLKWRFPDREDDHSIHLSSNDIERTLCGLAFEGDVSDNPYARSGREMQDFVTTKQKANCEQCIEIWKYCKSIKPSEIASKEKSNEQ